MMIPSFGFSPFSSPQAILRKPKEIIDIQHRAEEANQGQLPYLDMMLRPDALHSAQMAHLSEQIAQVAKAQIDMKQQLAALTEQMAQQASPTMAPVFSLPMAAPVPQRPVLPPFEIAAS